MQRFILLIFCFLSVKGFAQVATYDFSGIPATPATTSLPASSVMNVTASALTEGSGITPVATSAAMNTSSWNSTAMDGADYFELTLTPTVSHVLNVMSLAFGYRRSATGPSMYQIGYTIGGGTEILTAATALAVSATTTSTIVVPLSITTNQPVRFRIYAWGASSAAGTFRLSNITGGTSGVTINGTAPLPVKLLSFTGQSVQGNVVLSWATAWEEQNEGFDILKSQTGAHFEKIGFIEGYNIQQASTYSFIDTDVTDGHVYYYRLRQRDVGGGSELSNMIDIRVGMGISERQPLIYPNPSRGHFILSLTDPTASSIRLYTSTGVEIPVTISSGSGLREISLEAKAPPGLYYLRIQRFDGVPERPLKVIIQ